MDRNAWRTPPEIFAVMSEEFDFQIDVAASISNALCKKYIDESIDALGVSMEWLDDEMCLGSYAWCNPPYSDIGPWVSKAAEQVILNGVGVVMLVMADTSVGWYKKAIETCQEVRFITGGRLAFLDPETGKPVGGNNKGSMFLIWHPFAKGKLMVSHVDRDQMMAKGAEIIKRDLLMHIPF
jgi:phage N-6-adenine-methyltransferase